MYSVNNNVLYYCDPYSSNRKCNRSRTVQVFVNREYLNMSATVILTPNRNRTRTVIQIVTCDNMSMSETHHLEPWALGSRLKQLLYHLQ